MFNTFRTHQRPLLILLTAVAIVAFVWLYNPAELNKLQGNNAGEIYGRTVKIFELQQYSKLGALALRLGLYDLVQSLSYGAVRQDDEFVQFAWNSMVVDAEAKRLGLEVSDDEVREAIRQIPAFSNNGVFDPARYQQFITTYVTSMGISPGQIDDLIRTSIRLKKLQALIEAPVVTPDSEIIDLYARNFQKVKLQAVGIGADELKKDVTITEDEIKTAYTERAESLQVPAEREIEYVTFPLTEEQKKLAGKERADAQKAAYAKASEFAVKMAAPGADFAKLAEEAKLTPQDAGVVTEGRPAEKLPKGELVGEAVRRLTDADPNSDVLQGTDEFYVLHLKSFKPARQKTLEESKKDITDALTETKAQELAKKKAEEIHAKLQAEIKAGKTFADAAAAANLKVIDIPPMSRAEPDATQPISSAFLGSKATLVTQQLTDVLEARDGYAIGFVQERLPVDRKKYDEERDMVIERISMNQKMSLFFEWLAKAREKAGLISRYG